jgi:hypothetical protein
MAAPQPLTGFLEVRCNLDDGKWSTEMFKGFWNAALGVAGLAAVGLFVFYMLYKQILGLGILIGLSQIQSFVVILLLAVLIFFVAIYAIRIWYLNNRSVDAQQNALSDIHRRDTVTGIEIEIPQNCSFRLAATALARTDKATIKFTGFTDAELNTLLLPQAISTSTIKIALERFGDITRSPVRPYNVTQRQSTYQLTIL